MENKRKYSFSWDLIGDIQKGRPNLGPTLRLEVFRLMQCCFRDVIEARYGADATDVIFRSAGKLAGQQFYDHFLPKVKTLSEFVSELQRLLQELGIGILRVEKADMEKGALVVTVSEDLDCSGLPALDFEICVYDEGFISGLLESFTGKRFRVVEIDCWCTGDTICRFSCQAE